ncbi:hypothetical protein VIB_000438 [Vibrio metschnikovii CIP 69.14]|nr:hypothetical protein VIB_000438 [Vibrio metschnikovii CIP 69.14]
MDCEAGARADFSEDLQIPATEENLTAGWYKLAADDRLLLLLCQRN